MKDFQLHYYMTENEGELFSLSVREILEEWTKNANQ